MKHLLVIISSLMLFSFLSDQSSIPALWNRFERWLGKNAPHLLADLNAPVADSDIVRLETVTGTELPGDFRKFLKNHNGQKPGSEGLIDTEELLSAGRILDEWKVWKELLDKGELKSSAESEAGVKPVWWSPKWIPITYDGNGNHYCLDLDPAPDGKKGQVIRMWHDSAERELVAPSFKEWFTAYVTGLEKGKYVYSKEWGGIIKKDDLD